MGITDASDVFFFMCKHGNCTLRLHNKYEAKTEIERVPSGGDHL